MIWFHQNYGIPTPFLLLITPPPCPPHRLSHPFLPFVSQSCAVWSLLLLNWNFLSGVINKLLVKCDDPSKSSPTSASLYHLGVLLELSSFDLSHVMCPESPRPSPTGPPHLPLPVSPPRPSLSLTRDLSQCHGLQPQLCSVGFHTHISISEVSLEFSTHISKHLMGNFTWKKSKLLKLRTPQIRFIIIISKT